MPVTVRHGKGKKPWKIIEKATGRVVGESSSAKDAKSSARIRNAAHFRKQKSQRA